jgi:hypothetical protein
MSPPSSASKNKPRKKTPWNQTETTLRIKETYFFETSVDLQRKVEFFTTTAVRSSTLTIKNCALHFIPRTYTRIFSRDNADSVSARLRVVRLGNRVSIPDKEPSPRHLSGSWAHLGSLHNEWLLLFHAVTQPGCEANYSAPSSVEVKSE